MSNFEKDGKYDHIVLGAVTGAWVSGPLIIVPVPGFDLTAIATVWAGMAVAIAKENGVQLEKKYALEIAIACIKGAGAMAGSLRFFTWIMSKIPGAGMAVAATTNTAVNTVVTVWYAFALIDLFDQEKDKKKIENKLAQLADGMKPKIGADKITRIGAMIRRIIS